MADAGAGFDHRDARMVTDKVDQRTASARDDEVHQADRIQQLRRRFAVGREKGADGRVDTQRSQHIVDDRNQSAVRAIRIRAPFQYAGIPALEAEGKYVEGDVRAGFVYHADHAEGNGHFPYHHTVRPHRFAQQPAEWRREGSHVLHISGDARQTLFRQLQTVVFRIRRVHAPEVFRVGGKHFGLARHQYVCRIEQDTVDSRVVQHDKPARGGKRLLQ